jgi:hypothetical protein
MRPPKAVERISALFPFFQVIMAITAIVFFKSVGFLAAVFWIYLSGPLLWRMIALFFSFEFGKTQIGSKQMTSVWMISYNIQLLYSIFPRLEKALLIVPGLYSAWLRLWGAQIGQGVFWTPGVEVVDRPLISVGRFAILGQNTYLSSHTIIKRDTKTFLFLRPISVGEHAVIGAFSVLTAGAKIKDNETVKGGSICSAKQFRSIIRRDIDDSAE